MIAPAAAKTAAPHSGRLPAPAATGVLAFALPGGEEDATATVDGEPRQDDADPGKTLPSLPDATLLALFAAPVPPTAAIETEAVEGGRRPLAIPSAPGVPGGALARLPLATEASGQACTAPFTFSSAPPAGLAETGTSGQALWPTTQVVVPNRSIAYTPPQDSGAFTPSLPGAGLGGTVDRVLTEAMPTPASTGSARVDAPLYTVENAGIRVVASPQASDARPASVQRALGAATWPDAATGEAGRPAALLRDDRAVAQPIAFSMTNDVDAASHEAGGDIGAGSRFAAAGIFASAPAASSFSALGSSGTALAGGPLASGAATIDASSMPGQPMTAGGSGPSGSVRPGDGQPVAPAPLPPHWQVLAQTPAVAPTAAAPASALVTGIVNALERPKSRSLPDGSAADAAPLLASAVSAPTVAAPPGGERTALDMRQDAWPHGMIRHIERLQDATNAADTRIRLVPDALGSVEVDVRRDGDTLHVRFSAEQAQTRALIQEAQPRLAEAAEQRGLRLGQASVDAGASGQSQQRSPQQATPPRPAPSPRPERDAPTADDRIA